jgi:5-methylcytosine-specific restriction endonuclease McrA
LKRRISNAKRRAEKVTTASPNVNSYIELLHTSVDKVCPYCLTTDNLSIDHILPLSRGGTHTEDNVELVCLSCNIRKGTKTKEEFIEFLNMIKE